MEDYKLRDLRVSHTQTENVTKSAQRSYPFLGPRGGLSVRRSPRSFSYTIRYDDGWGVLTTYTYPYG